MDEPIIDINQVTRLAHQAVEAGEQVDACPYPDDWSAADRWRRAYHAREMELRAELATA